MIDLKVVTVTFHSLFGEIADNLKRTLHWIEKAHSVHADIICFPEMHLTGYACHKDMRMATISMKSDTIVQLSEWAMKFDILILAGFAESSASKNIYATHGVFFPDGKIDIYRKTHIAPPEKPFFSPGETLPVFEFKTFRFALQLCYDAHFPGLTTALTQKGIDILFIPHASPRGTPNDKFLSWLRHLPARAYDNSIYVIAVNQCGDNGMGLCFPGISICFLPSGEILNVDLRGNESLSEMRLTHKEIDNIRNHRMKFFFPNRRSDLY